MCLQNNKTPKSKKPNYTMFEYSRKTTFPLKILNLYKKSDNAMYKVINTSTNIMTYLAVLPNLHFSRFSGIDLNNSFKFLESQFQYNFGIHYPFSSYYTNFQFKSFASMLPTPKMPRAIALDMAIYYFFNKNQEYQK